MARPLRMNRGGVWFHLAARGIDRKDIFLEDAHRRHWVELLEEWVPRFRLHVHALFLPIRAKEDATGPIANTALSALGELVAKGGFKKIN